MTSEGALLAFAPAKLTLTLRVLGTRPDGFHELEALTVMVGSPCDRLTISAAPAGHVTLEVIGAGPEVPRGEDNLAVRAARAVMGDDLGIAIELVKQIPVGGGLGGGSADAAAVLRTLRDRFAVPMARIRAAAESLGSDVPVCVDGMPVLMRGRGELLEPVTLDGPLDVVVATPGFGISTPAVFRAWDDLGGPTGDRSAAPSAVASLVPALVNDLEPAAEAVDPRLAPLRSALEGLAGEPVHLAGSGSSLWWPVGSPEEGQAQATRVRDEIGVGAFAAPVLRSADDGRTDSGG